MKNHVLNTIGTFVMMTLMLTLGGAIAFAAAGDGPMKPELAAKKENVRKQRAQRVTEPQRRTAADALKAERMKVHQAREQAKRSKPQNMEAK